MTPRALLARLRAAGISVSVTPDGQLHLEGDDAAALSPELEEALRAQRAGVLALLTPTAARPRRKRPPAPSTPLAPVLDPPPVQSTVVRAPTVADVPAASPLPDPPTATRLPGGRFLQRHRRTSEWRRK